MRKQLLSMLIGLLFVLNGFSQPITAASTPPLRNASDVISLFSNAYSNVTVNTWSAAWDNANVSDVLIAGDDTKLYTNLVYSGIEFTSSPIDATTMQNFHVDIWTPDATTFHIKLVDFGPNGTYAGGDDTEYELAYTPSLSGWVSYDIPLTDFVGLASRAHLAQMLFISSNSTVYFDNVYFWKSANAPSITGFTMPAAIVGDAPFTITEPTSNSTGSFTYTSGNTSVATISGDVITIVSAGSSVITATQAPDGSFGSGTATATLVVGYPAPLTAAPTPTRASSDVISLFSNAYTNVPVDTWSASWDNANVADVLIAGDDTKKYTNLVFSGTEFTSTTVDASAMQNYHIDIWTPDATTFHIKLVDFGANGSYGGGDDTEQELTYTPSLSGWVSYDIPMTDFAGLTARVHLAQMIFVSSNSTVYVDNVYFWKSANAPVITGFTMPTTTFGDAPFTITAPTSNSAGSFTYTSSNTSVATVSGDVITIVGVGSSVITATQAADGAYSSGSVTATLVVGSPAPLTAAPTPTRAASDVISLYSNAYTNVPVDTWSAAWDNADVADILISGNDTKVYTNLVFSGTEFTSTTVDASTMENFHIDIWTPDATTFHIKLVDFGANGSYGGGDDSEHELTFTPSLSGWVSYDIPMTDFVGLASRAHLAQMIFVSSNSTVYMDNVYFWRSPNAPTITGFTMPATTFGDAPFTITAPTSNSAGAFTYTSSNTSVATISGDVITIVGVGTSVITATQAADGAYGSGSVIATLLVDYPSPLTAAPTPTRAASDVISLYSNAYTNVPVDTWSAVWDNANVADILIAGNDTKKYTNLVFSGTEFTSAPVDATTMDNFHIDVWTPNATTFHIKLVDFGANGSYGGGDDTEYELTFTPSLSGWVSYDIPMTDFVGLASRAHLAQLLFVSSNSTVYVDNIYFWKPEGTLPVTLTSFTAVKNGKSVLLKWNTQSESNNRGFVIERSNNSMNWSQLQFVNSVGNSTTARDYNAIDRNPMNGINYYRLRQLDNDGRQTFSSIANVKFENAEIMEFSFYPNPAKNSLNVILNRIESANAKVELIDAQGRVVLSNKFNKQDAGILKSINISALARGVYILKYSDASNIKSAKVLID